MYCALQMGGPEGVLGRHLAISLYKLEARSVICTLN